jgi:hypothetical protein
MCKRGAVVECKASDLGTLVRARLCFYRFQQMMRGWRKIKFLEKYVINA